MKLKGKAIFELTNVETGEKRVVKEENMVTNAFKYLIQDSGVLCSDPSFTVRSDSTETSFYPMSANGTWDSGMAHNMIKRYTNGLLLFEGPLEENPDHIYVTADDPELVGVGAEIAYIGNQTLAGSYNTTESGAIENGYKHVWDFTTSQANGDIGCACLTTLMGAGLGGGSGFPTYQTSWYGGLFSERGGAYPLSTYVSPIDDYFQQTWMWAGLGYFDCGRDLLIRPKDFYAFPFYSGSASTSNAYVQNEEDINGNVVTKKVFDRSFIYKKSIDLEILRFPFSSWSIFDRGASYTSSKKYQNKSTTTIRHGHLKHLETVTVNMPQGLANLIPQDIVEASINTSYFWPSECHCDEGFMYISFIIPTASGSAGANKLKSGDKIYVWKINMNTFESSYFTITNTVGKDLAIDYDMSAVSNTYKQWIINNDYTILFDDAQYSGGHMWIIDNATGSTIKQVVYASDETAVSKGSSYHTYFIRNNMAYFFNYSTDSVHNQVLIVNLKTGYCRRACSTHLYRKYVYGTRTYGSKVPKIIYINTSNDPYQCYIQLYPDPSVLMTINNLEDVVTKTSAETMKVTYIITEEVEE